jgi:raffinose/stachyose/melibiose transport system substrate-binding protein
MKRKLFVLAIVAFAVTAVLLTGCSGKKSGDAETVNLVYWSMWNQTEPQAQVLEEGIRDFEKQNPGIKVEINWNGREIRKTLQPALDNRQTIDIWDEDLERVVKTWGSYALKLDPYLENTYPTTGGAAYKNAVMGSLIELAKTYASDGGVYAVPYQPFVFAFMYNKDHFKQAGIASTPTTWDELVSAMGKLKAAGFVPMTMDDAYVDTLPGYYLARAKGYQWVEQLVNDGSNALWDDPAVLQMAKDFEAIAKAGYVSDTVASNKWPAGQQDVAAGTVTMYLNGTWLVNEIMGTTGPEFPWGTFSFPTVANGVDDGTAANYGSQAFQINKDCANPEAAFALLAHLTTGQWDKELAQRSFGVPVGGTTDWPVQLAEAKAIFNNLKICYPWAAGIQANTDKLPVIVENFTRLLGGTITAEQFVAAMKR